MFDKARTPDLDNSLKCLWCKALVGLDKTSPAYDNGLAYDMLPSVSRWIVRLPERSFPRLVHFIIELRTIYLDRSLQEEIKYAKIILGCHRIRLITLGAGYDTRSVKFLNNNNNRETIDEAWELDIEQVIHSKSIMLKRLQHRRPTYNLPNLVRQDLTDTSRLTDVLDNIIRPKKLDDENDDEDDENDDNEWYTIFVVEGVLIYLKEEDRSKVLSVCSKSLKKSGGGGRGGSFLFADRIRKLRDPTPVQVESWLQSDGWNLVDNSFCVHPGKARHMGAARVTIK
jgi:hypothetical protein